ncbi:MAG: hypothetical protein ABI992_08315 [Chthoniobacterales bacterium]
MTDQLAPPDRLTLLQKLDRQRVWHSLDERRLCVICRSVITGREVVIREAVTGQPEAHCPTAECNGTPGDWFHYASACAADPAPSKRTEDFSFL